MRRGISSTIFNLTNSRTKYRRKSMCRRTFGYSQCTATDFFQDNLTCIAMSENLVRRKFSRFRILATFSGLFYTGLMLIGLAILTQTNDGPDLFRSLLHHQGASRSRMVEPTRPAHSNQGAAVPSPRRQDRVRQANEQLKLAPHLISEPKDINFDIKDLAKGCQCGRRLRRPGSARCVLPLTILSAHTSLEQTAHGACAMWTE